MLEDGKKVEVNIGKKTIISDIKEIRKLKQNEGLFFIKIMPGVNYDFFPIIINKQFYSSEHVVYLLNNTKNSKNIQVLLNDIIRN